MNDLTRSELLKLRTTRLLHWNILGLVAAVTIAIASAILGAGTQGIPSLDTTAGVRNVFASASASGLLVLVIGIVAATGEHRHGTITSTLLITPRPRSVLRAKTVAAATVGVGCGAAAAILTCAVAWPWLVQRHVHPSFVHDGASVLIGSILATALYAVIGVALGTIVRSQTAALAAALVWMLIVENVVVGFATGIGRWLPGGAASALTGSSTPHGGLLPAWAGALLLAGYTAVFTMVAARAATRDVS